MHGNTVEKTKPLYLDGEDDFVYNSYSIKDQELFQQDAVPPIEIESETKNGEASECVTPAPAVNSTPIHKQIPKIALNFTKWKLQ